MHCFWLWMWWASFLQQNSLWHAIWMVNSYSRLLYQNHHFYKSLPSRSIWHWLSHESNDSRYTISNAHSRTDRHQNKYGFRLHPFSASILHVRFWCVVVLSSIWVLLALFCLLKSLAVFAFSLRFCFSHNPCPLQKHVPNRPNGSCALQSVFTDR